ncbi:MAG: UMP kinase [Conexivisphaerales archaeon]
MRYIIKLSGSILDSKENLIELKKILNEIKVMTKNGNKVGLVVGGGRRSREFIETGRIFNLSESELDQIGIALTRINAMVVIGALYDLAYPRVVSDFEDAAMAWNEQKIPVMGGLTPGHSTNAVAALLAEYTRADLLINATKAGGVFDRDPTKYPNALMLENVSIKDLKKIISSSFQAGKYELMDEVALGIIERSKIRTKIIGADAISLRKALKGKKTGTYIVFE